MITMIKIKSDNNKIHTFVTQQYEVGLYVADYVGERCVDQYGVDAPEKDFHLTMRKRAKELGDTIIEEKSTPLEVSV